MSQMKEAIQYTNDPTPAMNCMCFSLLRNSVTRYSRQPIGTNVKAIRMIRAMPISAAANSLYREETTVNFP
ncbi:hypothetical protein DPMN_036678 [Dreissena polymorpha]|uniref:Uncharacterized protein n=1 Tax=Dreissena polymorpha TaxID=45954 RepID=A0A9D4MB61_DREPO|nr:hypothetical protein DPMN_036678 [Dreissena polymorpha]